MDTSESNIRRIANALVDALVEYMEYPDGYARILIGDMTKLELLVFHQIHEGNMENMVRDIEDECMRIELDDRSEHIKRLVMSDHNPDVLVYLGRLPKLTELVMPVPSSDQLHEFLRSMNRITQLESVYLYHKDSDTHGLSRGIPSIESLEYYDIVRCDYPPYCNESVEYHIIKRS